MGVTETAAVWVARPALGEPTAPGAVRWGVIHVPSERWVAFGSEARCRQLVAHVIETDAIRRRPASDATGSGAQR